MPAVPWTGRPKDGLTDYNETIGKFQANVAESQGSTPEFLAEAIYSAATDGKTQLRYLIGPDAEQLVGLRKAHGDDAFVETIKQQMLS